MKGEDLLKIIGGVRPEYVEHASCSGRNVRKRWVLAGQIAALAAGLALVILIGLAVPKLFRGDPAESDPSAETAASLPSSEEGLADVTTSAVPSVSHSETAAESSDSHTANSGGIRDSYLCFNGMLYLASDRQLTSLPEGFSETAVILSVDTDHMPTGELSATRLEVGARLFSRGYTVHDTLYVQQKDGLYETFVCASPVGTLEQFAQIRPVVFYGTCVGEKDPYGYALFEIKEAYRGETGKELYVELWNDYPVEVGEEYICYGVLSANVFLDRIFCSVNELITPDGESVKTRYISDLEGRSFEDILQMLPDIIERNPYAYPEYANGEIAGDYIHSSDREEIEELSEYVAAVKAVSIQAWRNNLNYVAEDRQLVLFEVVDVIKGNLQTGEINILVPAHRIEDGKTYQICFRYYGAWSSAEGEEEQSYYIISAPDAIWAADGR
jgi:hypothetical protein